MDTSIALVTGANRGIGLEISRQLAASGSHVVMTSRDASAGEEACHALATEGASVSHAELDVSDLQTIEALMQKVVAGHGGLDALVNNAGVALDGFDADVARRTIDINFFGALRVYDAFRPRLRPHARVVMVSSGRGDRSCLSSELEQLFRAPMTRAELVGWMQRFVADVAAGEHDRVGWPSSAYRVSKIGLNKLTEVLAAETHDDPRSLKINAACPGWVRTRMGGSGAPRTPEHGARTPTWLATIDGDAPSGGFFRDEAPASW